MPNQELETQQAMFSNQPGYLDKYRNWQSRHPYIDTALEVGAALSVPGQVAKRIPDAIGSFGKLQKAYREGTILSSMRESRAENWAKLSEPMKPQTKEELLTAPSEEKLQETINTSLGFLTPEHLRHPIKRQMMQDMREMPSPDLAKIVSREPGGMDVIRKWEEQSPPVKEVRESWKKIIEEGGEKGPYKVAGIRGEGDLTGYEGSRGPVPGRGRLYAPYPSEAASYTTKRGDSNYAKGNFGPPWMERIKNVNVEDIEVKRPLVVEYNKSNYYGLKDRLNLSEHDRKTLEAIRRSDDDRQLERFWSMKAREAGYDAILLHDKEGKVLQKDMMKMRLVSLKDYPVSGAPVTARELEKHRLQARSRVSSNPERREWRDLPKAEYDTFEEAWAAKKAKDDASKQPNVMFRVLSPGKKE